MKNLIFSALFILTGAFSIAAQLTPPGAGDKSLEDRNIKNRSIELERVKRDADKQPAGKQQAAPNTEVKFAEIKEDFEKIQNLQNKIVEAYTKGKQINYAEISTDAEEMNKSGVRLKGNLFPAPVAVEDKKDAKKNKKKEAAPVVAALDEKQEPEKPLPADVKSLIVELDNLIMVFTSNAMFTNPQIVSAADNAKAASDLERIIKLSAALKLESDKMAKPGN